MAKGFKVVAVLALGAAAGAGVVYAWLLVQDSPSELAIGEKVEPLAAIAATGNSQADLAGRWVVQPGSEVGYRVREKLVRLPSPSEAVGRTQAVTGGLTVEGEGQDYSVHNIAIEADLTKLESNSDRRDDSLRTRGLETDKFPTARFDGMGPVDLPDGSTAGRKVRLTLEGKLTIHNVTRQVSIPVEARLSGGEAEVAGSVTFPMGEFGIVTPDVANIVTVEPTGTMEFRLLLRKAA